MTMDSLPMMSRVQRIDRTTTQPMSTSVIDPPAARNQTRPRRKPVLQWKGESEYKSNIAIDMVLLVDVHDART